MKLLVLGGWYGSGNVGDDSILIGVNQIFQNVLPNAQLYALSTFPTKTHKVCGINSIKLKSPKEIILYPFSHFSQGDFDAVLITGGTPFYDYDHISRFANLFPHMLKEKPIICFGVGSKNIFSPWGRFMIRFILSHVSRISVRDRPSLIKLHNLTKKNLTLTGDSALFIKEKNPTLFLSVLDLDPNIPTVAICPRNLSTFHKRLYHDYLKAEEILSIRYSLRKLTQKFIESDIQTLFLPLHMSPTDNDLTEIQQVTKNITSRKCIIIDQLLSPNLISGVLGSVSLVVGLRLHSLILAASSGVPIVSIGYDSKIFGFMDMAGVADYVVDPMDLERKSFEALSKYEELKTILSTECESMRTSITEEARRIKDIFTN